MDEYKDHQKVSVAERVSAQPNQNSKVPSANIQLIKSPVFNNSALQLEKANPPQTIKNLENSNIMINKQNNVRSPYGGPTQSQEQQEKLAIKQILKLPDPDQVHPAIQRGSAVVSYIPNSITGNGNPLIQKEQDIEKIKPHKFFQKNGPVQELEKSKIGTSNSNHFTDYPNPRGKQDQQNQQNLSQIFMNNQLRYKRIEEKSKTNQIQSPSFLEQKRSQRLRASPLIQSDVALLNNGNQEIDINSVPKGYIRSSGHAQSYQTSQISQIQKHSDLSTISTSNLLLNSNYNQENNENDQFPGNMNIKNFGSNHYLSSQPLYSMNNIPNSSNSSLQQDFKQLQRKAQSFEHNNLRQSLSNKSFNATMDDNTNNSVSTAHFIANQNNINNSLGMIGNDGPSPIQSGVLLSNKSFSNAVAMYGQKQTQKENSLIQAQNIYNESNMKFKTLKEHSQNNVSINSSTSSTSNINHLKSSLSQIGAMTSSAASTNLINFQTSTKKTNSFQNSSNISTTPQDSSIGSGAFGSFNTNMSGGYSQIPHTSKISQISNININLSNNTGLPLNTAAVNRKNYIINSLSPERDNVAKSPESSNTGGNPNKQKALAIQNLQLEYYFEKLLRKGGQRQSGGITTDSLIRNLKSSSVKNQTGSSSFDSNPQQIQKQLHSVLELNGKMLNQDQSKVNLPKNHHQLVGQSQTQTSCDIMNETTGETHHINNHLIHNQINNNNNNNINVSHSREGTSNTSRNSNMLQSYSNGGGTQQFTDSLYEQFIAGLKKFSNVDKQFKGTILQIIQFSDSYLKELPKIIHRNIELEKEVLSLKELIKELENKHIKNYHNLGLNNQDILWQKPSEQTTSTSDSSNNKNSGQSVSHEVELAKENEILQFQVQKQIRTIHKLQMRQSVIDDMIRDMHGPQTNAQDSTHNSNLLTQKPFKTHTNSSKDDLSDQSGDGLIPENDEENGQFSIMYSGKLSCSQFEADNNAEDGSVKQRVDKLKYYPMITDEIKNKLKIDIKSLKKNNYMNQQSQDTDMLNNKGGENDAPLDYHDEFMSQLDQFSLSWRNAAMNDRKKQKNNA